MVPPTLTPDWIEALRGAAHDIATTALSFADARVGDPVAFASFPGAHIALLGGPVPLELAVLGAPDACRRIATTMLMTDDVTDADVADAVREVVNMFAGSVKRRMRGPELLLGLPVFASHLATSDHVTCMPLALGPIELFLVVISPRR